MRSRKRMRTTLRHPSRIIKDDFMADENVTYQEVANGIGISENQFMGMLKGKQYLSPLNAVKIARFFGKPDAHFLVLQARHQAGVLARNKKKFSNITTLAELRSAVRKAERLQASRNVVRRRKTDNE